MLNDEVVDKVVERLVRRIEQGNEYVLEQIGKSVKKIGTLSPSKAQQLAQLMKYGGDYDKIAKKLAEITNMNVKDIYKIFEEIAKSDYEVAEKFYDYRNKKYIPYEENIALQDQVRALAEITAREYVNIAKTMAFVTKKNGRVVYSDLARSYQNLLDEAILNVGQGKETFDSAMKRTLKQLGESGVRTVDYKSGRSRRLDSAVRMNLKGGITHMHDEIQKQLGKDFDADGVEISVHENPALDHEDAQGKQFSNEEYEKLQTRGVARSYDKEKINMHLYHQRTYSQSLSFRPIGEYNCYHYIFSIILGVSEPNYSKEELRAIKKRNHDGFDLFGQHLTMYEGTQMQRRLETEIRKAKDTHILAKASDNKELMLESQMKINELTQEYRYLCNKSGLPEYKERMKVSGYKRVAEDNLKNKIELSKEKPVYKTISNQKLEELQKQSNIDFSKMNKEEKNAVLDYSNIYYEDINKSLFATKGDVSKLWDKADVDRVNNIDKVLKPTKDNIIVYKGTSYRHYNKYNVGDNFTFYGFNSCSASEDVAQGFFEVSSSENPCEMEIRVPKGTKSIYIGENSKHSFEQEMLLDRGLEYKIIEKTTIDYFGEKKPKIIVEVVK